MIIEYVEGETIASASRAAPLSTAEVINYSDQCLTALSYAHKQNIIHRDIKPANMMLTPDGIVKTHGLRHRPFEQGRFAHFHRHRSARAQHAARASP